MNSPEEGERRDFREVSFEDLLEEEEEESLEKEFAGERMGCCCCCCFGGSAGRAEMTRGMVARKGMRRVSSFMAAIILFTDNNERLFA